MNVGCCCHRQVSGLHREANHIKRVRELWVTRWREGCSDKGQTLQDPFFQRKLWRFCKAFFQELSQNNNTVANEWCSVAMHCLFTGQLARVEISIKEGLRVTWAHIHPKENILKWRRTLHIGIQTKSKWKTTLLSERNSREKKKSSSLLSESS